MVTASIDRGSNTIYIIIVIIRDLDSIPDSGIGCYKRYIFTRVFWSKVIPGISNDYSAFNTVSKTPEL